MKHVLAITALLLTSLAHFAVAEEDHGAGGARNGGRRAASSVTSNSFNVTRPLVFYGNRLTDQFVRDLAALDGNGHWLDGGSGEGIAAEQYHQVGTNPQAMTGTGGDQETFLNRIAARPANQRAHVTGLTYHMNRRGDRSYGNRLRFMTGRFFEDVPDEQIGRTDLISDVYGVFAYTRRLDQTMAKYLKSLKPDGKIYLYMANSDRTTITVGNQRISLSEWLGRIEGIRVETEGDTVRITKTGAPIKVPQLEFRSDNEQTPPTRVFKATGAMLDVPSLPTVAGPGTDFTTNYRQEPTERAQPLPSEQIEAMNTALGYTAHPPRR